MEIHRKLKTDEAYKEALEAILKTIELAQVKVVMAANSQFLWAYWNIGNELSVRTKANGWGAKVIDTLSKDIRKKNPTSKGFSARNLLYMRQFAEAYPPDRIMQLNNLWEQVKSNTQQLVALLKNEGGFDHEITQPTVAQFKEADFTASLIGRISWSHHLVLMEKCPQITNRF
jgi:predicted nuclease of restriction endonuclease-like (RecB) superfamily